MKYSLTHKNQLALLDTDCDASSECLTDFLVFVPFWCDLIMGNEGQYHNTL